MLGTTASKVAASVVLVAASAGGTAGLHVAVPGSSAPLEQPVVLDSTSLLVATLADGELQTQWMPREACERVASAIAAGNGVAGVREDGVKVYIARANCSTRRIEANPQPETFSVSQRRE
jgi:hypothetical protein